jgi:hypothetical protein
MHSRGTWFCERTLPCIVGRIPLIALFVQHRDTIPGRSRELGVSHGGVIAGLGHRVGFLTMGSHGGSKGRGEHFSPRRGFGADGREDEAIGATDGETFQRTPGCPWRTRQGRGAPGSVERSLHPSSPSGEPSEVGQGDGVSAVQPLPECSQQRGIPQTWRNHVSRVESPREWP